MPEEKKKENMTVKEAGHLGGIKGGEKGGEHSWTASPGTAKTPELTEEDRRREEEICAKLNRGEELTTEEAGFLGGVERVRQAQGEKKR